MISALYMVIKSIGKYERKGKERGLEKGNKNITEEKDWVIKLSKCQKTKSVGRERERERERRERERGAKINKIM